MGAFLKSLLTGPLSRRGRLLCMVATLAVALSFGFPLWRMLMVAPQYPSGLQFNVYATHFVGGRSQDVDDLAEINTLNHYIGMNELHEADFPELKLLPAGFALAALVALGAVVTAKRPLAVGALLLLGGVGGGGLASAYARLYQYGHALAPDAPVKVEPFTPVFIGTNQLANFTTTGQLRIGALWLTVAGLCLVGALLAKGRRQSPGARR